MNIEEKLASKISEIHSFSDVKGDLHHIELEGEVSNRMFFKGKEYIVWCINDYLGLMNNPKAKKIAAEVTMKLGASYPHAARMTFGQSIHHETLEKNLAQFIEMEDACLINLGYLGIYSSIDAITDRHDILIYDQKVHACMIDAVRIHNGRSFSFKHNDVNHLETQLKRAKKFHNPKTGIILVVVDGVYSMHGEQAPLKEIVELKKKYDFNLVVDDSHGFGILGVNGRGTPEAQNVEGDIDLYMSTFTKALGSIGGFISGRKSIIEYLRYNTRATIFSRTMPLAQVLTVRENLKALKEEPFRRVKAWENTKNFQNGLKEIGFDIGNTASPITPVKLVDAGDMVRALSMELRTNGIFTYTVCYPVVERGTYLIRMVSTYNHTEEDISITLSVFQKLMKMYKDKWLRI